MPGDLFRFAEAAILETKCRAMEVVDDGERLARLERRMAQLSIQEEKLLSEP